MSKVLSYGIDVKGLVNALAALKLPVLATDPTSPVDGYIWVNSTGGVIKTRVGGATLTLGTAGAISVSDTASLDLTLTGQTISGVVLDSPTVGGATPAQLRDRTTHTGTQSADTLTDGTTNKAFLATERTKLTGIATGATANSTDAVLLARANHTGTESADVLTDGTTNKAFLATERTKLTGIATGATANSTDAVLLARANHTGTEPVTALGLAASGRLVGRVTAGAGGGEELTPAQVKTLLAIVSTDISDFATAAVAAINAASNVDADTLGGQTAAQIQTAVTAAIVNGAPGTLDTLGEIAAQLQSDESGATALTTVVATKGRVANYALTGGALTEVVTHNFGTRALLAQVYDTAGAPYEDEDYIIQRTTTNTITVVSEGQNIPTGRSVFIVALGT
jgi:NADH dehydrogenase/NADH:ubiquinone oxidoreductase subunit G